MRLQPAPFQKVKNGTKTIEIRINDEKRQRLSVGDELTFTLMDTPAETLQTKIKGLKAFPTFKELFEAYSPEKYGGEKSSEWPLMYKYYSEEEEKEHGVVAIEIELV